MFSATEIVYGNPFVIHVVILTFSKSVGIAEKAEKRLGCIGIHYAYLLQFVA